MTNNDEVQKEPTAQLIDELLESMLGSNYEDHGIPNHPVCQILRWEFDDDYIMIYVTSRTINRPICEAYRILQNKFVPTDKEYIPEEEVDAQEVKSIQRSSANLERGAEAIKQVVESRPKLKSLQTCDLLMDELMAAVQKVKTDKEYVNQAQVITNISGKVIEYAKVEISSIELARKIANT